MFDSLSAAYHVVAPMALLMGVGVLIRRAGVIDRPSMRALDRVTFSLFMPALMFKNIYGVAIGDGIAGREAAFVTGSLLAVFLFALLVPPRLVSDHNKAASIGQIIIRSNYILFGVAVAGSLYGEGGAGPVALLGTIVVPATNALAVVILETDRSGRAEPWKILRSVLKNPMVIAALLALTCKALKFQLPGLLYNGVTSIAGVTTTISFISLGVSLDLGELRSNRRSLILGVALRMIVVPVVFLPIVVALGFRGPALCAMMILFAAPAGVACYPMAVAMGADGQLAGQLVCCTTVLSIFTLFLFTFAFRIMGLL